MIAGFSPETQYANTAETMKQKIFIFDPSFHSTINM